MIRPRELVRAIIAAGVLVAALSVPSVADAHTDLASSSPADGATVTGPLMHVTLTFTKEVTTVADGFEMLDPQGVVVPIVAETSDNLTFRLPCHTPIVGGVVGLRYRVAAADGHIIEGALSFTVEQPAAPAAAPSPASTAPAVVTAAVAQPTVPAPAATAPAPTAPAVIAPVVPPTTAHSMAGMDAAEMAAAGHQPLVDSAANPSDASDTSGSIGRGVVAAMVLAVAVGSGGFLAVRRRLPAKA